VRSQPESAAIVCIAAVISNVVGVDQEGSTSDWAEEEGGGDDGCRNIAPRREAKAPEAGEDKCELG